VWKSLHPKIFIIFEIHCKVRKMEILWDEIFGNIENQIFDAAPTLMTRIRERKSSPFKILISTIISARTKDDVTCKAVERLFGKAPTIKEFFRLSEKQISDLIYPVGFYRVKAGNIKKTTNKIIKEFNSTVPDDLELLLSLPGVGIKTANLVLSMAFNQKAICVDVHVHRISNRMGWVETKKPEETEKILKKILPDKYKIAINDLLVLYGQNICRPISPFCSSCHVSHLCKKIGVKRSR